MSSKKDMRRAELVVPYSEPKKKAAEEIASTMTSTLPMAAMFMRNRMIGWAAFVFALQTWMAETPLQKKKASTPAYLSILMALTAIAVTYLPLFLPPTRGAAASASAQTPS